MLTLLAGTAAYLVLHDREEIWRSAHDNALNVALGLEAGSSVLMEQPVTSLRGIRNDVARTLVEDDRALESLQNAMRYDPVSVYLGIETANGALLVVGRDGRRVGEPLQDALRRRVARPEAEGLAVQQLIQLPGREDWYMPITLKMPRTDPGGAFVFSLVAARQMVAGADSLRLLPDSYVTFAAADGRRLLRYRQDRDVLEVNGPPLLDERLERMREGPQGSFEMRNSLSGAPQIAGYVASRALPMYVAAVVPMQGLYWQWARESTGPVVVLVMGIAGVIVFALHLRAALLRQARFLSKEQYRADHDRLTGLLNRDAFVRRIDAGIREFPTGPFAVVLLDISHFKDINDTLGHAAGDEVLKITGRRMVASLGEDEDVLVARLGGDELGIAARAVRTPEELEALCLRLQGCLSQPIVLRGVELELGASMGTAVCPDDARTASELMRCADIAMHDAKGLLKPFSRYVVAMDQFAPEILALKAEFAKALRERTLGVVYQPKVRLADGALVGAEVLARWEHPVHGAIPPGRFVPLAENTELIHPFTAFILETALGQVAAWRAAGFEVPVAVNVSANNLLDHAFNDKVRQLLEELELPPRLLELEVTESAVMRHPESIVKRLQALRELGVLLSIDDFGTGYASLTYLKRLPVHTLKIDMSFILNLELDEADQRIVRSSIRLGHGFGMSVVAEGVETARAAAMLTEYECDSAQGWHFARPMPAAEFEAQWLPRAAATRAARGWEHAGREGLLASKLPPA